MKIKCLLLFHAFGLLLLAAFTACHETKDPDQALRVQQLLRYSENLSVDLSQYDYVLVEGSVQCKGCAEVWPKRLLTSPLVNSSVLFISGEAGVVSQFGLEQVDSLVTDFDSIESAFPYIANYFLFYRSDKEFDGYVELGARNSPIPESSR